jgi:hypothetical protein
MGSLQRDPDEVRDYFDSLGAQISFDMFLNLMQQVENQIVNNNQEVPTTNQQPNSDQLQAPTSEAITNIKADTKVLDFLRLLEEYRRKCEEQGNYSEAKKSRSKFEELLRKETQR